METMIKKAGRRADPNKRQTVTFRLKPESRQMLREMKARGIKIGVLMDGFIESEYRKNLQKDEELARR